MFVGCADTPDEKAVEVLRPLLILLALVYGFGSPAVRSDQNTSDFTVQLDTISSGFDKKTCWVHPRAGILPPATPGNDQDLPAVVLTMNKLLLTGSDVYYAINDLRSDDLGKTWTWPIPHKEALGRWDNKDGTTFWPAWHAKSGKLLGIGHTVWFTPENRVIKPRPRHTGYSVYNPVTRTWGKR